MKLQAPTISWRSKASSSGNGGGFAGLATTHVVFDLFHADGVDIARVEGSDRGLSVMMSCWDVVNVSSTRCIFARSCAQDFDGTLQRYHLRGACIGRSCTSRWMRVCTRSPRLWLSCWYVRPKRRVCSEVRLKPALAVSGLLASICIIFRRLGWLFVIFFIYGVYSLSSSSLCLMESASCEGMTFDMHTACSLRSSSSSHSRQATLGQASVLSTSTKAQGRPIRS